MRLNRPVTGAGQGPGVARSQPYQFGYELTTRPGACFLAIMPAKLPRLSLIMMSGIVDSFTVG